MSKNGKFIVIEGIDGSGKKTQTMLLKSRLEEQDIQCEIISFPRYGHPAAYFEERYLVPGSPYGTPEDVGSKRASIFYAIDRYDASMQIKGWLNIGAIVIADRYLISNAAHQGGKIDDKNERSKFVEWLYDLEYGLFDIPKPDKNIILKIPIDLSAKRVAKKHARLYLGGKEGKKDVHEESPGHLENAQETYLWMAEKYPEEFEVVSCTEGQREFSEVEIHEKIWNSVFSSRDFTG